MIFHMGLAKHMNTYFRKSFPFQNSQIFLNMYFSYWAYIYLHFFILRQNSHLRMIKKGIVWMHRMVTWKYLSLIKCLFWMENSLRKYVLLLEMIQAFGDIFKNTFPQHRWLFWKPSKYFIVPAGCLNFDSCYQTLLCQQCWNSSIYFGRFHYSLEMLCEFDSEVEKKKTWNRLWLCPWR